MAIALRHQHRCPNAAPIILAGCAAILLSALSKPAWAEPAGDAAEVTADHTCEDLSEGLRLVREERRSKEVAYDAIAEQRQGFQDEADALQQQIDELAAGADEPPAEPAAGPVSGLPPRVDDDSSTSEEPPPELTALQVALEKRKLAIKSLDLRLSPLSSEIDALKLREENLAEQLDERACPTN